MMNYIGLLTDKQKRAGFFVSQDEDFIYLFYADGNSPRIVAVFPYATAAVREVRETAERELRVLSGEVKTEA